MKKLKMSRRLTPVQMIVLYYVLATLLSTFLLWLPIFHQPHVNLSFIDALFTATSAISVTGLGVVSTADTFNVAGTLVLAVILQFGGIGILTLGTFIWIVLGRKIGLEERKWIAIDQNRLSMSGLVALMQRILYMSLVIEAIGTLLLGSYFLYTNRFPTWYEAYYYGLFTAISAYTNAGFDIFGNSLYSFAHDYFVQTINMLLMIVGSVGFPVLLEVREYLYQKKHLKKNYRFSLYAKLTSFTFFALIVIGALLFLLFEKNAFLAGKTWHESLFYSLFNSVTTRNGGLATMDVGVLTVPTLLMMSILMFIGASPSSVGGGIRTTTFAVIVLTILAFVRGKKEVKIFHREIHPEDIFKSFVVFFVAMSLVMISVITLAAIEPFPLMAIIFEAFSAFGTTGLSMGITPDLSIAGKCIIMGLMFIGRIGIISFLFLLKKEETKDVYHYPKERIMIG
ncbi:TrkH family potassium uptake protein [Ammoniphilus resinae]|uniref:Potassium uptake TrkH family protein n=1 Tax=Ammoniphilus resinae TaxID=861532 RepID=A0ABS4GVI8_9BACL|nr:TrkH family potassium uptake protein [Ammoniphilus resinae]MBP1934275.1 potassium uptake TrkH family protein [Ammoniphilus resinae]